MNPSTWEMQFCGAQWPILEHLLLPPYAQSSLPSGFTLVTHLEEGAQRWQCCISLPNHGWIKDKMVRKIGRRAREASPSSSSDFASSYTHPDYTARIVSSLEALNSGALPGLVVFDLDYTLWPLWVDTHVDSPLRRRGNDINKVYDRNSQALQFFPHVPSILFWLKRRGIPIAAASRTSAPTVARQALNGLFLVDDSHLIEGSEPHASPKVVKAADLFEYEEIYPGSKITHFRNLQRDSGVEYEDMIFFDDEYRNAEVGSKLGVHFVEVGHAGTDLGLVEKAIREWRAKKAARAQKAEL